MHMHLYHPSNTVSTNQIPEAVIVNSDAEIHKKRERRISRPSPSYLIKSRNYQDLDQHGDSDSIHQFGSFPLLSIRNRIQLSFRQYDVL
jgi:hypothetical protein